jgi:hypothetical protein
MHGFMTKLALIGISLLLVAAIAYRIKMYRIIDEPWDVDDVMFWSSVRVHSTGDE